MDDLPMRRVGGACALALGLSYLLVGALVLLDPTRAATSRAAFYEIFAQAPAARLLTYWGFVLCGLFALGAIAGVSDLLRHLHSGLVRWTAQLAYLAAAVTALSNVQEATHTPRIAALLASADAATRQVLLAAPSTAIDIYGWLRYGGLGVWMLTLCALALRARALPTPLGALGLAGGLLYLLLPAASLLSADLRATVEVVAAVLGGMLIGPAWFIWMGARLLRGPAPAPQPAAGQG